MINVGWENGRLVPVSAENLEDAVIRAGGVDSIHPVWGVLDEYVRICQDIAAQQNILLPRSFGQVDQVAPWVPWVVESPLAWKQCQQKARRLGSIHFGLRVVEHTRLPAHYQRAITPLSVTYFFSCALPGFPYSLQAQRFWLHILHTRKNHVRDDRMGGAEQVASTLAHAWTTMTDRIQAAGQNMLVRCYRKGAVR